MQGLDIALGQAIGASRVGSVEQTAGAGTAFTATAHLALVGGSPERPGPSRYRDLPETHVQHRGPDC
ncbi:Uncharacterised protein [Propionibacterium australiense]|uniref:Uncharacterized protein n=1 Tax=Propionibacterium australiense TaxID=119981 RepID=A0A383S984_9ACTN|nr:hypothetical protein [Propionibacterium australiense]SYZ34548.1 Hypothetical protein PROPAUS_2565 [Propionibacterium australiense]VEH89676.1 Uncharacterised protein [Propionibacterium australiense]